MEQEGLDKGSDFQELVRFGKNTREKYTNVDLIFPVMIEILLSCQGLFNLFPDLHKTLLGSQQRTLRIVCFDLQSRYASKKIFKKCELKWYMRHSRGFDTLLYGPFFVDKKIFISFIIEHRKLSFEVHESQSFLPNILRLICGFLF